MTEQSIIERKSRKQPRQHQVQAAIAAYHSPLPPANVLKDYEEILPGTTERVLALTEKQQAHRHKWELKKLDSEIRDLTIGRVFGVLVLVLLLSGAFIFGFKGMELLASCFLGAAALGTVPHFISGKK